MTVHAVGSLNERSLLQALRTATGAAHAQVESRLALTGEHCSVTQYAALLRALFAVVEPSEHAIHEYLRDHVDLQRGIVGLPLSRTERLRQDLDRLGATTDGPPTPVPVIASAAQAFGAAYVLQGSLLGGAVIARALRARLGLASDTMTYLRLYDDGLGQAWREFTQALEAFGRTNPSAWPAVINSARATFHAVDSALTMEALGA